MKRRYFFGMAAVVLMLTGCALNGGSSDKKTDSGSSQVQSDDAHTFYVTEKGDDYILMESGDGFFTQRLDCRFEDGNFYYTFSTTNNTPHVLLVNMSNPRCRIGLNSNEDEMDTGGCLAPHLYQFKSGITLETADEHGVVSLDYYRKKAEESDNSKNYWNSDGENVVWLAVDGIFDLEQRSNISDEAYRICGYDYTYPYQTGETDYKLCFVFDKDGNLKA